MLLELGKSYNFTTYAPPLFQEIFRKAKVIGLIDYEIAKQHANVDLLQRQIYPLLPPGTPDRISKYSFVLFESASGKKFVMAYYWIVEDSIVEVVATNILVTVYNTTNADVGRIRDALNTMGYLFKVEEVDI